MISAFAHKKVLVYGYGVSGKAAAKLLDEKGARVFVYDDKKTETEFPFCLNPEESADTFDLFVVSPSVGTDNYIVKKAQEAKVPVIGELELAYAFCDSEIVAVTGTNGKTTVCKMIKELIAASGRAAYMLGNSGVAFSEKAAELLDGEVAVVETSSFQLSRTDSFEPEIAVVLNVKPDHLDYHKTFGEYVQAKSRILQNQTKKDHAVFNFDDRVAASMASKSFAKNYYFSKKTRVHGCFVENNVIYFEDEQKIGIMETERLSVFGDHNLENALAAITVACIMGINPKIIENVMSDFRLPDFRMQFVGRKGGKNYFNDSKGTNVSATLAALAAVSGDTLLILGGSDKGECFDELFEKMPGSVKRILVTGANGDKIIEAALRAGRFDVSYRATLKECVTESLSFSGENVVFSPSSASFDKFSDYVDRGNTFNKYFSELPDAQN
ncbi:MAG: UDP-N-acetylmuramoyl-L-alanine--D-glutamate ligase [Eubacteriales bacterium]|nr:UDP-N-acetylmuramoyl-L-alanine--D-glutamate ligase [Eubacteriales bacterium]